MQFLDIFTNPYNYIVMIECHTSSILRGAAVMIIDAHL